MQLATQRLVDRIHPRFETSLGGPAGLRWLSAAVVMAGLVLGGLTTSAARADVLNALDFPSLGTVTLAAGTYSIDTDGLTLKNSSSVTLYTGTLYANSIAVFAFSGLTTTLNAVTINVTGRRPLAILSSSNLTMQGVIINLNGVAGSNAVAGQAGSGGGTLGGGGSGGGFGGIGGVNGQPGFGGGTGGGGGQLSTGGGFGGGAYNGGPMYGNLLVRLEAGSGGSGGNGNTGIGGGGGQGGGGLELGALGTITLGTGTINAIGGNGGTGFGTGIGGGGGSGGAILLHALSVNLPGAANHVNAGGGNGIAVGGVGSGGGGGGRVTIQSLNNPALSGINVAPGTGNALVPAAGVITSAHGILTTTTLDFGNVAVGSSKTLGMLIQNAGDADTTINGQFPAVAAPFTRVSVTGNFSDLHTGEFKAGTYTFTPTAIGTFSQTVNFLSDGGNIGVTITGMGVSACRADFNGDMLFDGQDIPAFVDALTNGTCP